MSLEELRIIWTGLLGVGIGASVAGVGAVLIGKPYLSSYLQTKGKNLATREDVQQILDELHKTARVRHQNADFAFLVKPLPCESTTYAHFCGSFVVATA